MICRKDSLGYVDFMRGKYPIFNKSYITNIIEIHKTCHIKHSITFPGGLPAPPDPLDRARRRPGPRPPCLQHLREAGRSAREDFCNPGCHSLISIAKFDAPVPLFTPLPRDRPPSLREACSWRLPPAPCGCPCLLLAAPSCPWLLLAAHSGCRLLLAAPACCS